MSLPAQSRPETDTLPRPHGLRRVLPLLVVIAALAVVFASGLYRDLSLDAVVRHHAAIIGVVAAHRAAAFVAYVGLYIAVVARSVQGALVVPGPVVFVVGT